MPKGVYERKSYSKEHKKNISESLKKAHSEGRHEGAFKPGIIPWNKKNFGATTYKELNHNIRTSKKWNKWREKVFKRDNWTCQNCGKKSGNGESVVLHPHHIISVKQCVNTDNINLIYQISNGITLCFDCHWDEHRKEHIEPYKEFGED